MKKIFCFGDGFATGHIWPEWPQILQALLPDYEIVNTAGVGAGAEFLVSGFVDRINEMRNSTAIFQWPFTARFDKLIEDSSWDKTIADDPVYHFNVNTDSQGRRWWLSSASKSPDVRQYHDKFVQFSQHVQRQLVYKTLVTQTAENLNCKLIQVRTEGQDKFSHEARFAATRQNEVQPSPVVHFYWLIEKIIPQLGVEVNAELQAHLELLINQTKWVPYDPDREEIWSNLTAQLPVIDAGKNTK